MFNPALWANIILFIHLLFVLGIIVPIPLIILGNLFKWQFVRNPWFRNIHLALVGYLILQTVIRIACPLTVWEQELRTLAGQQSYTGSFFAYWADRLLYYNFPPWVFHIIYFCVAVLIVALYFIVPPQRKH